MGTEIYEKIKELSDRRSKKEILKSACGEIRFTSKSRCQYFISIVTSIVLGIFISQSVNTVAIMRNVVSDLNGVLLALIAMIFGSYSIFQALLSRELVGLLIETEGNILKESNRTFLNLTILYVIGICVNIVLDIALEIMPDNFLLINNVMICNIISWMGIVIYLSFHLLLILEVINFALNLYRMFCVYNTLEALDSVEDSRNAEEK